MLRYRDEHVSLLLTAEIKCRWGPAHLPSSSPDCLQYLQHLYHQASLQRLLFSTPRITLASGEDPLEILPWQSPFPRERSLDGLSNMTADEGFQLHILESTDPPLTGCPSRLDDPILTILQNLYHVEGGSACRSVIS